MRFGFGESAQHPLRGAWVCLSLATAAGLGCADMLGDVSIENRDAAAAVDSVNQSQTACEAGAARCQGAVLQACEPDGSGWTARARCASPALCAADSGQPARCLAPLCTPGITCDGAVLRQCNADSTGFDRLDTCVSPAHCDAAAGACLDAPCTPGALSCNGNTLQRCNAAATGHDAIATCASPALCDRLRDGCAEDGCAADAFTCPEPSCEPGELRCSGARLETCNAGRDGWVLVEECVTEGVCQQTLTGSIAFGCAEPACNEGDVRCSPDGERLTCNAARTEYAESIGQCRSADACAPEGCLADTLCEPGSLSCNGNTLEQCRIGAGARPTRVALDECATRGLCLLAVLDPLAASRLDPSCTAPACAPGEHRCQGAQMQVCNADRSGFDAAEVCASAALCEAGAGTGACPVPCSGAICNGSMLRLCNAELTGFVDAQDCGTASSCDSVLGSCAGACLPGELRCNGQGLERCQGTTGWQRVATCESPGLCQASVQRGIAACALPACAPGQHRCAGQQLEVCNAAQTGFAAERACRVEQICDAANGQCDNCVAGTAVCIGNVFTRCSDNGQLASVQACGEGLCAASGSNLGCLQCGSPDGYRCDGASLLFCSADQRREIQVGACGSPEACRADLGACAGCAPAGSSRCDGDRVVTCLADGTEALAETCVAGACEQAGATAACADRCAPGAFQCSPQGEVLICDAAGAAFVAQTPRVFCGSFAACDPEAGQCTACAPNDRRCRADDVQACKLDRSGFETLESCGAGFECVQRGTTEARCECAAGTAPFCEQGRLTICDPATQRLTPLPADHYCDGNVRVTCSAAGAIRTACPSAPHCEAGTGPACAGCLQDGECASTSFCSISSCNLGNFSCEPAGVRQCLAPTPFCSDALSACVECLDDADCPSDGVACNGPERCQAGACAPSGLNPCAPDEGECVETATGFDCTNPLLDVQITSPI